MNKLLAMGFSAWLLSSPIAVQAATGVAVSAAKRVACPAEVEPLIALMLRDLPGYANRIILRSTRRYALSSRNSVLTAGRPEFAPLPLKPGSLESPTSDLRQVFITTLEQQTTAGEAVNLQQYHWLFLAKTQRGWQLALMFSRTGPYPAGQPPTPPRESSQGAIGQAIRIWLRDCNAEAVRQ